MKTGYVARLMPRSKYEILGIDSPMGPSPDQSLMDGETNEGNTGEPEIPTVIDVVSVVGGQQVEQISTEAANGGTTTG